jgi:hypothetical protein
MSDENKVRDAADAIKGIVESVPVYQDAIQPAARKLGNAFETVSASINAALAPIRLLVWGIEQIEEYVRQSLSEKLRHVPSERIVTPNPVVAVPLLQSLLYTAQEEHLRELFANLLATSMDSNTAQEAHPAFVEIIRQLTSDEAKVIQYSFNEHFKPGLKQPSHFLLLTGSIILLWPKHGWRYNFRRVSLLGSKSGCDHPEAIGIHIDNLSRLGLVKVQSFKQHTLGMNKADKARVSIIKGNSRELENQLIETYIKRFYNDCEADLYRFKGVVIEDTRFNYSVEFLSFSELGERFCKACLDRPSRV